MITKRGCYSTAEGSVLGFLMSSYVSNIRSGCHNNLLVFSLFILNGGKVCTEQYVFQVYDIVIEHLYALQSECLGIL